MRGGTLLILGHGVKGQSQLWHFVYKTLWTGYRLQFLPNHFQTSHVSCGWWEEESYWFWVTGSKVKVNFGTLCIRPCGHNSDFSFCPITFKLHMHIHHDERRNPFDFGSRGHRSRSTLPPARGCHALRCLVFYSMLIFKFQKVFPPPVIFRNAEREGITVLKCRIWISFGVILIIALVVTCYYLLLYLSIYWPYFDNMLTTGQTDWHRKSRVLLLF